MKKLVLSLAIIAIMSITTYSQLFDLLGDISTEYNIEDIAWKGDVLYAALGEGGVWYSSDEGFTWTQTAELPDAGFGTEAAISLLVASNGDLIVGGNQLYNGAALGGSVFRSSDDGASWNATAYEGLGGYEKSGKIVEHSNGDLMMQGGFQKLFTSSLSSSEWTQITTPGGVIFGFEIINDVVFVVTNPAGGTAGTWVTIDLGTTWSRYGGNGTPISGGTVTTAPIIAINNYKFIGIGGAYDSHGVFRSGINDTVWQEVNNGISNFGIYPICMATDNETLWMIFQDAGGGCYFTSSVDFANNWSEPEMGMPQQGVGGPCIPKMMTFKTHLYAFANTGIYRMEDVASPSATRKENYTNNEIKLYPNPVSDVLRVQFKESNVDTQWDVLNVFGQVMKSGQQNSNNNNILSVNMENLPVGYYILRTNIDGKISMNKFLKK